MDQEQLVKAVADSAHIADRDSADRAVRSTLRVLGYRLKGGQSANLAAQLPGDLGSLLPADAPGQGFDLEDFYRRVADDEGVPHSRARQHARATMAAVAVAVTDGEFTKFTSQLPADYDDLVQTEPVQHR
ncbi:DUF2267 domain-containing protein [Pseudonocardia endophytica]|uniref:Uncharacterized protein (DUF2267 family) n=1 Tax=Pseudonocardia endophytica TaxID=401976 RepID=A0A4R1I3S2_PSEEN|nr:DUF2267 domain-containing protein [Pseudonocardia endophytica]TCK24652.1 uncharacterized protein (DUF2267 family) [Pseudonocardia endophytica]